MWLTHIPAGFKPPYEVPLYKFAPELPKIDKLAYQPRPPTTPTQSPAQEVKPPTTDQSPPQRATPALQETPKDPSKGGGFKS
ncbi:hypothetical protein [Helicobacter salomonis]|uniref:hypothetical protein n=1 Tax=Helicobacter salomonis TaxID=56878 RepID=UPI000CF13668|nr:hypothetical protein [Helicobacter salomonis]